jgi:hypothetical protein
MKTYLRLETCCVSSPPIAIANILVDHSLLISIAPSVIQLWWCVHGVQWVILMDIEENAEGLMSLKTNKKNKEHSHKVQICITSISPCLLQLLNAAHMHTD